MTKAHSILSHAALAVLATTALLAACDGPRPAHRSTAPAPVRPDGDRGHGWFETAWGVEELDYEWRNGHRVYDGDLVLDDDVLELPRPSADEQALLSTASLRWAMGGGGVVTIPYEITNTGRLDGALFDRTEGRIQTAMTHWETYATRPGGGQLLRFVPHGGEARWVEFEAKQNGGVCYVNLRASGRSRVDADPACRWQTFVHEIGHALTFRHEQKRMDRPGNVIFHADRTDEDREFAMVSGNTLGTPYDSSSIMHYPSCMFALSRCSGSTPNAWVLERVRAPHYIDWWSSRPVGEVLSPTDRCGIRSLYDLSCAGGVVPEPDAGMLPSDSGPPRVDAAMPPVDASMPAMDAGVPATDAGMPTTDAGADAGVAPSGITFPVSTGVAGMLQRTLTGECAVAAPDGTTIELQTCDEMDPAHRWGLAPTSALRNEGSRLCAQPAEPVASSGVEQHDCLPDEELQRWRFGDMEIVNGSAGTCVSVPSSDYVEDQHLVHRVCNGGLNQLFSYLPSTHEILAQGWCLTAGASAGMRIELHACDGSPSQQWIETNGGFAANGLCMRIRGGGAAALGAVIEATDCNGLVGQMWGLRGHYAYSDDELCLAPEGTGGEPLRLGECPASETMIWWPRAACVPLSCGDLGATCGSFDDGCGAPLECGACTSDPGDYDAGPGEIEECLPLACDDMGPTACGVVSDDCGGEIDCGACSTPPASGGCACRAAGGGSANGALTFGVLALAMAVRRRGARRGGGAARQAIARPGADATRSRS